MRHVRKTGLTLLVGLTAVSTLIAGTPHFSCRCPNGQVKLFCLSAPSQASGCCCGAACCAVPNESTEQSSEPCDSTAEPARCCCCAHKSTQQEHKSSEPPVSVQRTGCVRTFVQAEQSVSESKVVDLGSFDWAPLLTLHVCTVPNLERASTGWQAERGPPPPDLVTVLRRLLI